MKSRRLICIYTCMYSCVLENCFLPTLFFCNACGSIWLIQNNQGSILTKRGHRLEPGNAGVRICSVKLVPLHCSSWLCFRCIILLVTYRRHPFCYVISKTSAFSKKEKKNTGWVLKGWMCERWIKLMSVTALLLIGAHF